MNIKPLLMLTILLVTIYGSAPLFATEAITSYRPIEKVETLTLEDKSFKGRIRATGIMGLFSVKGTLSFRQHISGQSYLIQTRQ